jgi:tetratricopeptide (TPR) repeat protein
MFNFSKRLIYALSNKIRQVNSGYDDDEDGIVSEGKLTVDFAKTKKSPFDIKPDSSYNAYLSNSSLTLGLKKESCIAWVDMPDHEFRDHVIEAKIRLETLDSYAASGIIFHIRDEDTYYLALVSSKGYFRLDAVKDNAPKTLIAWTDIPEFDKINFNIKIVTCGTYLIFLVNGKWLGEVTDDCAPIGRLGFVLASYKSNDGENDTEHKAQQEISDHTSNSELEALFNDKNEYICKAHLDYISVDSRFKSVEANFKNLTNDININAEGRLRLAETFAVMGEPAKALDQISRAWKRRDEVIRTVSAASEVRTKKELLLAARMAFRLGQYNKAEEFIDAILDQWADSAEGKVAYTEKIKILNELNKFAELNEFIINNPFKINKDIDYYILLAKCRWELKNYADSAAAWDKVIEMNAENGIYAVNSANAHEMAGNEKEALSRYISAGKIFLNQDNIPELAALMPKLSLLGKGNWEAHALAGKWAFSMEDYDKCAKEFEASHKIRCALRPRPKADPALYYLWGLVFYIKGRIKTAIRLIKRAVSLAPDYKLFRKKLEELILISEKANNARN